MGFSDKFKDRMSRNGEDLGEAYTNNTIAFIESTFSASPTFRVLGVKSTEKPHVTEMDARVVEVERMGSLRELLFRPTSEGLDVGTYVTFDNDTYLIFDRFGNNKVLVERCNDSIKWVDKNGNLIELECIASASDLGSKAKQSRNEIEWNKFDVRLPAGQLFIFLELNDSTRSIALNQRFIFGSKAYEVVGLDDVTTVNTHGFGIIQLVVKVTTIRNEDDFINRIAYNTYEDSNVITPTEGDTETGEGGIIW
jgi:hypothetical protein